MPTVAFHTLGCKVNQYDTQAMLECFVRAGYEVRPFTERADVYVVNTCTVTGTGDRKSMNAVRRAQRLNPQADVVIAGCLAQRDGEKLLETGARLILGASRRGEVVELLHQAQREDRQIVAVQKDILRIPFEKLSVSGDMDRTRAVIKIQEGCDRYCAYCIIPSVRGGIRSREPADIRAEAIRLANADFQELVLTGIHLTSYGRDLEDITLLDGIRAARAPGVKRLRLGSLEPVIATEAFARSLQEIPEICPQFHLALQSGSDTVLKRMRRRYTTEEFARSADILREAFPGCALTTDVITGFPGETEEEFAETVAFVRKIGFARIHVFPYSARQGTPAASMPGQVPKAVREERARLLIAEGKQAAASWAEGQLGRVRPVLVEDRDEAGVPRGYTPEYAQVRVPDGKQGEIVEVKLVEYGEDGVFQGEIVHQKMGGA